MSESIFCRSEKKEKRHAGRHHRRPARGRRDRGPGEDLVSDFGGGEQRWCDTEAAMRALAVLEQRLTALVPPGTSASPNPVDQRALFDVLSELASVLHRGVSSLHEVTQSQRGLEDALLRITCGGWAGPAVRNAAANTMCVLFLVGNQVGLFSAVSELAAVAFGETKTQKGLFKKKNQDANTTPLKAGLTPVAHARVSALDTLQRLARSGHAPTMRGAGSGIVESAEKLLCVRSAETALKEDGSRKGTRVVRVAVVRCIRAVVEGGAYVGTGGGSNPGRVARPLRRETRAAAGRLLTRVLVGEGLGLNPHANDGGVRATACRAIGALASAPGGGGMWTDLGSAVRKRGSAGAASDPRVADDATTETLRLLDDVCGETSAAASCALGKLAACRLRMKTQMERKEEAVRGTSAGDGATPGRSKKKSSSMFGGWKNDDASDVSKASGADAAAAAESADATAAAAPLDIDRPGGMELWVETVELCFLNPLRLSEGEARTECFRNDGEKRFVFEKRRRFRAGVAHALCVFIRQAATDVGFDAFLPKALLVELAATTLSVFTGGQSPTDSEGTSRRQILESAKRDARDDAHAAACASVVLAHGVLPCLDEGGRRGLTERLVGLLLDTEDSGVLNSTLLGSEVGVGSSDGNAKTQKTESRKKNAELPSAAATLRALRDALRATGGVDSELFALARTALSASPAARLEPTLAAVATFALAVSSPQRAALLLRDATAAMSGPCSEKARLGARVCAEFVARAGVLELGLPRRDVADAASVSFALAKIGCVGANENENENENENAATRAFGWCATASCLVFFSTHSSRAVRGTKTSTPLETPLDFDAVADALAEVLNPHGLIKDAEAERARTDRGSKQAETASGSTRLVSLSLFSPNKKPKDKEELSPPSSSYGSLDETPHAKTAYQPGTREKKGVAKHATRRGDANPDETKTQTLWPSATAMALRAAATDALPALARLAQSQHAKHRVRALLVDALVSACVPVQGGNDHEARWPRDDDQARAAATLRARALQAFVSVPNACFETSGIGSGETEVGTGEDEVGNQETEGGTEETTEVGLLSSTGRNGEETRSRRVTNHAVFDAVVSVCASLPTTQIPGGEVASGANAPTSALARLLDPKNETNNTYGPWPVRDGTGGGDGDVHALRSFSGARCALSVSPWRCAVAGLDDKKKERGVDGTGTGASLSATLRVRRAEALASVAAMSEKHRSGILAATALDAIRAATGDFDDVAAGKGSSTNLNDLLASNPPTQTQQSPVKHNRRGSSTFAGFSLTASHTGKGKRDDAHSKVVDTNVLQTSLTSACVTSLAVANALCFAFEATKKKTFSFEKDEKQNAARREAAESLAGVAAQIGSSPHALPAHWRAAAELDAVAGTILDDPVFSAEALLRAASALTALPVTRNLSGDGNEKNTITKNRNRPAAACACAISFRKAGALASGGALPRLAVALTSCALEIDGSPDVSHLWAAHALAVVAQVAGPAFHKRAGVTLSLVFALLNSWDANDPGGGFVDDAGDTSRSTGSTSGSPSAQSSLLRASCGRLINAAIGAVGPELDTMGGDGRSSGTKNDDTSGTPGTSLDNSERATNLFEFAASLMDACVFGSDTGGLHQWQSSYNTFVGRGGGGITSVGKQSGDDDDTGDGACRFESAVFTQQLALFAPSIATPQKLVLSLIHELNSNQPTLRHAACETLKHLCERDAGAVARASWSGRNSLGSNSTGSNSVGNSTGSNSMGKQSADGSTSTSLFGDLLFFVDRFGDASSANGSVGGVDTKASAHARRALRLLVKQCAFHDPSVAVIALARVALWVPGTDWSSSSGVGDDGNGDGNSTAELSGRNFSPRGAPRLATRFLAATLIAEVPGSHRGGVEEFMTGHASVCVDVGYRIATAPFPALRPCGLRVLSDTICRIGKRPDLENDLTTDPDTQTPFVAQFQAQALSALRGCFEPGIPPGRCFTEGALLASASLVCGVDRGDPGATKKFRAFVSDPIRTWLAEEENEENDPTRNNPARAGSQDSGNDSVANSSEDHFQNILTTATNDVCAGGILAALRLAALRSSAVMFNEVGIDKFAAVVGDEKKLQKEKKRNLNSLALKWATVVTDFADVVAGGEYLVGTNTTTDTTAIHASLWGKNDRLALDLGKAWRPCLCAATQVLFGESGHEDEDAFPTFPKLRFASFALALCVAALTQSLEFVSTDDDGPDAPLAKPLCPSNRTKESSNTSNAHISQCVKTGLPTETAAAEAVAVSSKIARWVFSPGRDTQISADKHKTLHESLAGACVAVVTLLDLNIGADDSDEIGTDTYRDEAPGKNSDEERPLQNRYKSCFVRTCEAFAVTLAGFSRFQNAAAGAVAIAGGLGRQNSVSARRASSFVIGKVRVECSEDTLTALRPQMLIVCVRALSRSDGCDGEFGKPFVTTFAELVSGFETPRDAHDDPVLFSACRFLWCDVNSLRHNPPNAAACASVCARRCLEVLNNEDGVGSVAVSATNSFFNADPSAAAEAAAFVELRNACVTASQSGNTVAYQKGIACLLRTIGACAATATRARLLKCGANDATAHDARAAAEGLKFWAALVNLVTIGITRESEVREDSVGALSIALQALRLSCVTVFLPLAIEAIEVSSPGPGTSVNSALASASVRLITSVAGSAPNAFRTAVGKLSETSTERLRQAMAFRDTQNSRATPPNAVTPTPNSPAIGTTPTPLTPPSFASFE